MYEFSKLMGMSLNEYIIQDGSTPISFFDVIKKSIVNDDTKVGITKYS